MRPRSSNAGTKSSPVTFANARDAAIAALPPPHATSEHALVGQHVDRVHKPIRDHLHDRRNVREVSLRPDLPLQLRDGGDVRLLRALARVELELPSIRHRHLPSSRSRADGSR